MMSFNKIRTKSKVLIFHDETKNIAVGNNLPKLWGHVLLFVPKEVILEINTDLFNQTYIINSVNSMDIFYNEILELRSKYGYHSKFHFKKISGKRWGSKEELYQKLLKISVDALRSKRSKCFDSPLFFKLAIIFFPKPSPFITRNYGGDNGEEKKLRFFETVLRMLLKGAVHFLYDEDNTIEILRLITDGNPWHRRLDETRILKRLSQEIRNYITFSDNAEILSLESDNNRYPSDTEEYKLANFLQVADMLLGAARHIGFTKSTIPNKAVKIDDELEGGQQKKSIISLPFREMLEKTKRGANFKNSGHYKSFVISVATLKDNKWHFEDITMKEWKIEENQLKIFESKEAI